MCLYYFSLHTFWYLLLVNEEEENEGVFQCLRLSGIPYVSFERGCCIAMEHKVQFSFGWNINFFAPAGWLGTTGGYIWRTPHTISWSEYFLLNDLMILICGVFKEEKGAEEGSRG